jgi:hypothetical protein
MLNQQTQKLGKSQNYTRKTHSERISIMNLIIIIVISSPFSSFPSLPLHTLPHSNHGPPSPSTHFFLVRTRLRITPRNPLHELIDIGVAEPLFRLRPRLRLRLAQA